MNFLSVLYARAGITVDGVTTLNNTATGLTPATNDNSTKLATTGYVKNQNYYPYPTGTTSQYVRGDGSLATFTQTGGGGSSVSYYLNGSVSQGTIGGNTYYEMSKTAIVGTNADFSINANGYVAQFVTDAGDPALLNIPGGNWNFEMFFSASSGGGSPSFYVELYKYDGTTLTLIASGSAVPESITGGTATDLYVTALAVPTTTLTLTDRLAIRVYVTHSGRTITLHTQNGHLCQIITTFTTGLTALNGLTAQVQNFAVGAGGSDFNISSVVDTHTFNLPTASATKRGALSSIDWSAFDAKVDFGDLSATAPLNYNGSGLFTIAQSSGSTNGYLSSTDWTTFNAKIGGSGTANYVAKFTSGSVVGNSIIYDNGTNVGIGTTSPAAKLTVSDTSAVTNQIDLIGYALNIKGHIGEFYGNLYLSSNYFYNGTQNADDSFYGQAAIVLSTGATNTSYIDFNLSDAGATNPSSKVRITATGNVLINTTTNAGYKLDVNGTTRLNGNVYVSNNGGNISFNRPGGANVGAIGWHSNDFFYVGGHPDYGSGAGNDVRVYGFGANLFLGNSTSGDVLTITNAGKVGIGTTSPSAKLVVKSPGEVGSYEDGFILQRNSNTAKLIRMYESSADGFLEVRTGDNGIVSKLSGYSGTPTYFLSNVGIGNINPTQKLDVSGQAAIGSGAQAIVGTDGTYAGYSTIGFGGTTNGYNRVFGNSGTADGLFLAAATSQGISFWTNGSSGRMYITPGGNVGINTGIPAEKLDVFGVIQARPLANGSSGNYWYMIGSITDVNNYGVANGIVVESAGLNSYAMTFGTQTTYLTGITEKMRITSGGNVLINTTTDAGYKFDVNGTARVQGNIVVPFQGNNFIGSSIDNGLLFDGSGNYGMSVNSNLGLGLIFESDGGTAKDFFIGTGNSDPDSATKLLTINTTGAATFSSLVSATSFNAGSGAEQSILQGGYLQFYNAAASNKFIKLTDDSSTIDAIGFSKSGSVATTWFPSGNVGIGTISPSAKLDVQGTNSNGLIQAYVTSGGGNALRLNSNFGGSNYIDLNPYISGVSNGGFEIKQNGTQRFVIADGTGNVGIGTTNPGAKFQINGGNLGTLQYDYLPSQLIQSGNGNGENVEFGSLRTSAGSDWTSAGFRIQEKIDATWMAFMQFNGDGNLGGISFGTGTSSGSRQAIATRLTINSAGVASFSSTIYAPQFVTPGFVVPTSVVGLFNNSNYGGAGWSNASLVSGNGATGVMMGGDAGLYSYGWIQGVQTDNGATKGLYLNPLGGNVTIGGATTITNLSGSGSRMVVADASGVLSTQAIPTGTVTGTGTTNYLPKFTGASALGDSIISELSGVISINGKLAINASSAFTKLDVKGVDSTAIAYFFNNTNTAGQVPGVVIEAGTNASDYSLDVKSSAGVSYFKVRGDGAATFASSVTTTNGYISANYNAGDVIIWGGIAPYANVYGALSWDVDKAIVKGRGGYALGLYVDNNVSKGITIATTGAATFSSSVTATNFIVPGGTSAQFLKADGSLDSNVYLTSTSSTFSYTSSVTLTTSFQNTGVSSANLGTGAYLITCNANDFGVGGGQYDCTYTGLMYFFAGGTNGSDANEIVLHHTGHADNGRYIYLRTLSTVSADGKTYLQISGNGTNSGASNYQFTFKKLL